MLSPLRQASVSLLYRMLVCIGLLVWGPLSARADAAVLQCRHKPAAEGRRKSLAGDLFARGERAFAEKQYAKALKRFLCSLYTIEHEATVTNIHEILKVVENRAIAGELLDAYIGLNPDGEMTAKIREIRDTFVGKEETEPETAEPEPVPEPVPEPTRACVTVTDVAPIQASVDQENRLHRLFGLAILSSGAAFIVAGAVFQGLSAAAGAAADDASSYDDFIADIERKKAFQTGAAVGFSTGALTAGLGIAMFVTAKKRQTAYEAERRSPKTVEHCTDAVPRVSAGLGSLQLSWSF